MYAGECVAIVDSAECFAVVDGAECVADDDGAVENSACFLFVLSLLLLLLPKLND